MKKNNKGFSLVELIVVIAIMAVLVGVLAPQFIKYVERSRISTDIRNMAQIKTAVEVYCAEDESLSGSLFSSDLSTSSSKEGTVSTTFKTALEEAGLDGTKVKFKSANWSGVNLSVSGGAVTVKGKATYKSKDYYMNGEN